FLNNHKSTDLRGRLARWTLGLQQHDFDIVYRPDLSSAQTEDPFCQEIRQESPLPNGFSDESGILFFGPHPVLPLSLRDVTFDLLHANPTAGHMGIGR
ncbi:uncharacterized protein EV154DRAFT_397453, partial [Mucor mucedo]|uniref:uncharacterized protein n=1 Tax=Mucor mucedo TaxID=29922 RepID=UPI0022211B14